MKPTFSTGRSTIDDCLGSLRGSPYWSALQIRSGYRCMFVRMRREGWDNAKVRLFRVSVDKTSGCGVHDLGDTSALYRLVRTLARHCHRNAFSSDARQTRSRMVLSDCGKNRSPTCESLLSSVLETQQQRILDRTQEFALLVTALPKPQWI